MARWGFFGLSLLTSLAFGTVTTTGRADDIATFNVIPAHAPNGPLSPSWKNYVQNAIGGIQSNVDVGNRSLNAAAYERVFEDVEVKEMIYTPFNSWRGQASPNPAFQSPFIHELGNRIHFGLHLRSEAGSGWKFALSDLSWRIESSDANNFFGQSGNFSGQNYSDTRVGINWGADEAPGGGDDVTIQSGPGTQLVHELIYVGVGEGFMSFEPEALNDQQDINATMADIYSACSDPAGCLIDVKATYSIPDSTGTMVSANGSFVLAIPEPSSAALASVGMALVLARRRKTF